MKVEACVGDARRSGRIRRVNIGMVAEQAGVSPTTVSHVLNKRLLNRYAAKTRKRVHEAVARLDYAPNASARAIGLRKFMNVGLVLSTDARGSYLPEELLRGIAEALHVSGYRLSIMQLPDEALADAAFIPSLHKEWQVDGLISNYTGPEKLPTSWSELLEHHAVPVVYINCLGHYPVVRPDDFRAGELAVERLAREGHRRIALISHVQSRHYSVAARREGRIAACRRLGLPIPEAWQRDAAELTAEQWAGKLAAMPAKNRPTAITFDGLSTYWNFQNRLAELDTRWTPAPCCVCLYVEHGNDPRPSGLVTMMFDWREIGVKAARLLVEDIAAHERGAKRAAAPREILQPPEFCGEVASD